ncbi:MAG: Gfo/Idh/MocA family oxidoreductase [Armatimonadetes bacterium]|nr:Gfo/Idh/MocA family oxidoreductase [Armatimonadota bacterium]
MKILTGKGWTDSFLDEALSAGKVRIRAAVWKNLEELKGVYFVRPKSLLMLWNYLQEVGLRQLIIKILSRSKENFRNEKYVSCGLGYVLEPEDQGSFAVNQQVVFVAPGHPRCMERIVLPSCLVGPISHALGNSVHNGVLHHFPAERGSKEQIWLSQIRGWNEYAGDTSSPENFGDFLDVAEDVLFRTPSRGEIYMGRNPVKLDVSPSTPVAERSAGPSGKPRTGKRTACLFGYGNYAKTCILPNIKDHFEIRRIHEIDPTQIPPADLPSTLFDTSPSPREDELYDAYFIASYHHTHAPLAIHALKHGAWAVVEKPVTTTWDQLHELLDALSESKAGLFSGFHKRYSPLNELAREDLCASPGDPVSYHCIVYEVPLPDLHWYRWPNSRSRIVSNGCHWLDHFLFLNNWSKVRWTSLVEAADGTLNVSAELENRAFFSMVLTDVGSERIGVQDYVELRANDATVKITNGAAYMSESTRSILRRRKINKVFAYGEMYRQIARQITTGKQGDSLQSIEASSSLILSLEDMLMENRRRASHPASS